MNTLNPSGAQDYDITILGAGPVGTTLALLLAGSAHRVLLLEQRPLHAGLEDPRALALSEGARQILHPENAWPTPNNTQDGQCTPIQTIHISQHGGCGRTLISHQDYRLPALGYVVRYGTLLGSLHDALHRAIQRHPEQITCRDNTCAVLQPPSLESGYRTLTIGDTTIRTRLLIHAEGAPNDQSHGVTTRNYHQRAIIFEATLAHSHHQCAWERFTPQGPLAILPLDGANGQRVSVVYTVLESDADHILQLDDTALMARLQQISGPQVQWTQVGARANYPLKLRLRQNLHTQRELWIGNAAQTLHPVSGQGFNLGIRDAALLAQHLRPLPDPGSHTLLASYLHNRQWDRWGAALFTDSIVRTFSTPSPLLNTVRGLGLSALDLVSPLRHFVARRMIWGSRAWP